MKRTTVLLLALVALLAHILTIQQDSGGNLGPPADRAHVAFRLGRSLVKEGVMSFRAGSPPAEAYPSWAWVAFSALMERLRVAPTIASQVLAIVCGLGSLLLLSRFSPDRLAGVIAPLLLAVCGPLAAAAGSGTEFTLEAMLFVAALLLFEAGARRRLTLVLAAGLLVRPEGALVVIGLWGMSLLSRHKRRAPDEPLPPQARLGPWPFAIPVGLGLLQAVLRKQWFGAFLSPTQSILLAPQWSRLQDGWDYLLGAFLHSGGLTLTLVAVLAMSVGRLSPRGRRALVLGLGWCGLMALQGGDDLPFWTALAPAAPLLFVAVQEALIVLIDGRRVWLRHGAWYLFFTAMLASLLASKLPSDLGPLPLERLQNAWLYGGVPDRNPLQPAPARLGLQARVARDERLRAVGIFFRDEVEGKRTILTPWPGAIGYLARGRAIDLLGRAQTNPNQRLAQSWSGRPHIDLLAVLSQRPDYILPTVDRSPQPPLVRQILEDWLAAFDDVQNSSERFNQLTGIVRDYDVISVRVPNTSSEPTIPSSDPVTLLRLRRLGEAPELNIQAFGNRLVVGVSHQGHGQMIDLEIQASNDQGLLLNMTPTGALSSGAHVHTRTGIWLPATGNRTVRLFDGQIPEWPGLTKLTAVLRNPGSRDEDNFSRVSPPVTLQVH